jgi:hypothetical protein
MAQATEVTGEGQATETDSEMDIKGELEGLDYVKRTHDYQTPEADISVELARKNGVSKFRVYYLKNLRDEFEWVDSWKTGAPCVLLKAR